METTKEKVKIRQEIEEEIEKTKGYEYNIEDTITPGVPKKYMRLNTKKAEASLRARVDMMDPTQETRTIRN